MRQLHGKLLHKVAPAGLVQCVIMIKVNHFLFVVFFFYVFYYLNFCVLKRIIIMYEMGVETGWGK